MLAMNEPSFVKFMPIVAPGGTIVVSDAYELPADIRSDVKIVRVPCFELASKLKNPRGANIIMTGAIIRLMGDFTGDEACTAMNHMFAKKGKSKFEAANTAAFQAGYNAL